MKNVERWTYEFEIGGMRGRNEEERESEDEQYGYGERWGEEFEGEGRGSIFSIGE